ncbi:lactadherin-like [Argopecten irradians]|uniref:lactadherin-like n=1 Tax=Argopecten irradians TaxID=31199 RepID=UPI003719F35A
MRSSTLVTSVLILMVQTTKGELCSDHLISGPNGVNNSALSASSQSANNLYKVSSLRLTHCPLCGWIPDVKERSQYVQVDFPKTSVIMAVLTRGQGKNAQYVSSYTMYISDDGVTWESIKHDDGTIRIFDGNTDDSSLNLQEFKDPVLVKSVRLAIETWNKMPVLKMELIGCAVKKHPGRCWEGHHGTLGVSLPVLHHTTVQNNAMCGLECRKHPTCESFMFSFLSHQCLLYTTTEFNLTMGESTLTDVVYFTKCTWRTLLNYTDV